jgi:hypothetical protein
MPRTRPTFVPACAICATSVPWAHRGRAALQSNSAPEADFYPPRLETKTCTQDLRASVAFPLSRKTRKTAHVDS